MNLVKYAVCAVLVVGSVVYAKHNKHDKHKKTEVVTSEQVVVTEPVQAGVGQEVIVDEGTPAQQTIVTTQPAEGEIRTEVYRSEVRTEGRCGNCRPCKVKCGKADIETLKGKACCTQGGLQSTIRYKVETEHVAPGQLELIMHFSHHGRLIADDKGQLYTVVVTLDQPTDRDDDELEYKGSLPIPIPAGDWGEELRIKGQVVSRADGRVYDRESGELELPDD